MAIPDSFDELHDEPWTWLNGEAGKTWTNTDRVLKVVQYESPFSGYVDILLDNSDQYFSDRNFLGAKIELGFGMTI